MDNGEWEAQTEDLFGNEFRPKEAVMTRISFVNIGGLPPVNANPQNQEIGTFLRSNKVDTLGMTETNVNWTYVNDWNRLHKQMMTWFESHHILVAHNQ